LPNEAALLGAAATDVLLDGIELGDVLERFACNGRGTGCGKFVQVTPHMRPAECKLNVATLGELAITGIAVDLQDPLEACEMGDRSIGFADRGHRHRRRPADRAVPWPVVRGIGPELTGLGAPRPGSSTGIVVSSANSFGRCLSLPRMRSCNGRRWKAACPTQSARRAIEFNALAGVNLRLPVERQVIGIFGD
jgi:hypothetical protein